LSNRNGWPRKGAFLLLVTLRRAGTGWDERQDVSGELDDDGWRTQVHAPPSSVYRVAGQER
jgi:hypothetical protein